MKFKKDWLGVFWVLVRFFLTPVLLAKSGGVGRCHVGTSDLTTVDFFF